MTRTLLILALVVLAPHPASAATSAATATEATAAPSSAATSDAPNLAATGDESILKTYPNLQKFLFAERKSNLYFGFGLSPMTIMSNRIGFSANLFQIHYINEPWDLELFSASFGITFAQADYAKTRYFMFRTAPKYRVFKNISIGPLAGLEFVNFPDLNSRLNSNDYFTPIEPFSTWGFIYGLTMSETFSVGSNHLLKINEMFYWENYPYLQTSDGWKYYFTDPNNPTTQPDVTQIQPSTVFVLEISFLL